MVQEAFIRWMGADRAAVREPEAFLRRTVTRLCLDQLKSARRRREAYVGPWLPEPGRRRGRGGGGRHPAADARARTAVTAGARGLPAARRVRRRLRGDRRDDPARARRPAGSSPPAPATHVREARPRFRVESSAASRSPTPSLPHRATATWARSAPCSLPTSACHTDGGGKRPAAMDGRSWASTQVMKMCAALAAFFARAPVDPDPHRVDQRPAGLRDPGSRRRAADDRARDRGRQDRGDLRGAQSGQAAASALGQIAFIRTHLARCAT